MINPLKIGHITFHYKPIIGGQEIYIKNLIDVLDKQGMINTVYQPINRKYNYFVNDKDVNVKLVFNIPFLGRFINNISKYIYNLFLLTYYLSLKKQDVLIVHYAFFSTPLWFFKKKVIIVSHGVEWDLESFKLNDLLHNYIAKKSLNRFTVVANDTHYFRALGLNVNPAKNYFKQLSSHKWFIPNCIDTNKFDRLNCLVEYQNKNIILIPRQITKDRGIDLGIKAFYELSKIESNYILLIVGPVREIKYKILCDKLINEYQINNKVIWLHNIDNSKMVNYYSSAKITLIPTLRREGTSLSALESMACGCPTVTTNLVGLKDLPTVQADPTPIDLSNKMQFVLNNWEEISKKQCDDVRNNFNLANWSEAWGNVIRSVVSNNDLKMGK